MMLPTELKDWKPLFDTVERGVYTFEDGRVRVFINRVTVPDRDENGDPIPKELQSTNFVYSIAIQTATEPALGWGLSPIAPMHDKSYTTFEEVRAAAQLELDAFAGEIKKILEVLG